MSEQITPLDPWGVFDHEVEMLNVAVVLLRSYGHVLRNVPYARNLVIEAGLLHLRAVVDLLVSKGGESDDMNRETLVGEFRPGRLDELASAYGDRNARGSPCWILNEALVHPTTERLAAFSCDDMLNPLLPIIADIVNEIRTKQPPR